MTICEPTKSIAHAKTGSMAGVNTRIGPGPPMVLRVVHAGSVNTAKQRAHQAPSFCSAELLFAADPKVTLGALTNPCFRHVPSIGTHTNTYSPTRI